MGIASIIGTGASSYISRCLGMEDYEEANKTISKSVGVMGNFAFSQLLRAEGNSIKSMMGMLIGTVLNVVLDPIFIQSNTYGSSNYCSK